MALDNMTRSLCNKMVDDYSALIAPINMAKSAVKNAKNQLQALLNSMVFSVNLDVITTAVDDLQSAAAEAYPSDSLADMLALKNMIDNCSYLEDSKPISSILGTTLGVFEVIDGLVSAIVVPEFLAADIGNGINNTMSGLGIPGGNNLTNIFKKADKLINCLSIICGAGAPTYITIATEYADELDDLYNDMNIVSNPLSPSYGQFDYNAIYTNAGMSSQDILQVNTSIIGVGDTNTNALTSIDNATARAKDLVKGGFF